MYRWRRFVPAEIHWCVQRTAEAPWCAPRPPDVRQGNLMLAEVSWCALRLADGRWGLLMRTKVSWWVLMRAKAPEVIWCTPRSADARQGQLMLIEALWFPTKPADAHQRQPTHAEACLFPVMPALVAGKAFAIHVQFSALLTFGVLIAGTVTFLTLNFVCWSNKDYKIATSSSTLSASLFLWNDFRCAMWIDTFYISILGKRCGCYILVYFYFMSQL